jgi:hypothetical protein
VDEYYQNVVHPPSPFLFLVINSNFFFTHTRTEAKVTERVLFIFGEIKDLW